MNLARKYFALYNLEQSKLYELDINLMELLVCGEHQKFVKTEEKYE